MTINDLAPLMRAGTDDRIGVDFPDGGATTYMLANPQDQRISCGRSGRAILP